MSEAAAADVGSEEEVAEGAAPAGTHSLMDHLFQRIGQHKEKVILGFAYATCDVAHYVFDVFSSILATR